MISSVGRPQATRDDLEQGPDIVELEDADVTVTIDNFADSEEEDGDLGNLPSTAFSPINFNVTTRRIGDIFSSYNEHELDTTPAFQRGYVWDRNKASRLIESVLLHVPLPLVYTAEEQSGREVVIDGQQRLMTFIGFLSGKFPQDHRPFHLTQLKILKHLNGKSFTDLPSDLQVAFRRYGVQIIRISDQTHEAVKFEIFERLNTGAVTLSAQELRNCIYRGNLNNLIKALAADPAFKRALSTKTALRRMTDSELVLRFLTFYEKTHHNYPGKMKAFMNDFMKAHQNIDDKTQDRWRDNFIKACDNVHSVFGDKAFRRYKAGTERHPGGSWETAINRALFDAVMFWFARFEKRQIIARKDLIRERIIEIMTSDKDFSDAIQLGTSDPNRVKTRFEILGKVMRDIIDIPEGERRLFTLSEKTELFEANPTCAVCKQRIESIDDAEVDHRVPFAQGGPTELGNARVSHRYCNRSRR